MADLREQLLAAFEAEQGEHVAAIRATLARLRAGEAPDLRDAFRRAHSLKGAARAVDAPLIEDAAHQLEALFAQALEAGAALGAAGVDQASQRLDAIERQVKAMYAPAPADAPGAAPAPAEFLRVGANYVQQLSASMHELSSDLGLVDAASDRLHDLLQQAQDLSRALDSVGARHAVVSGQEIALLAERSRALTQTLASIVRQQSETAWAVTQAAARVREHIERVAMTPASSVFAGLDPMMGELAAASGREIAFRVEGLDAQADRRVLQSLRDPVIHLLRNAVAHGVETPAERKRKGKRERGQVDLLISIEAGRLVIRVRDDGAGPDAAKIEEIATARGLLPARTAEQAPPSSEVLYALVFEPGFSTAEAVDRIAGRGMGLSVVAEAAKAAGGGAYMRRLLPWGTEVVISTPVSVAHQPVLLAREGSDLFALPTFAVERVLRLKAQAIERLDGRRVFHFDDNGNQVVVPVVALSNAVGVAAAAREETGVVHIAVLRQGDIRVGVSADAFESVRAATITSLRAAQSPIVTGAIQLEQNKTAIVIDADEVLRRAARGEIIPHDHAEAATPVTAKSATILVVDDSITTRTLEKSILEAQGYRVRVTVDGLDALAALRAATEPVDIIVADIEMPNMDGFQLLQALKSDAQLASIPVILMTSRAAPEDVRRGLDLGADAYLVKQEFDQRELLATIGQLL